LSRATMDGWVMQVGQMLMPVVGAMKKELLGGSYLQADETPVEVVRYRVCKVDGKEKRLRTPKVI
jgi:hypothetical protein